MNTNTTAQAAKSLETTPAPAVNGATDFATLQAEAEAKASEVAEKKANAVFADYLRQKGITDDALKGIVDEWNSKRQTPDKMLKETQAELEKVRGEFSVFKKATENQGKQSLIEKQLLNEHLKPNLTSLIAKEFDLEKIEVENGVIKGWETLIKPVKEKYGDFFGSVKVVGAPPAATPHQPANADPLLAGFDKGMENKLKRRN